ncbi:family 43 glycosylhydrolase [Seonamhaeicola marinus]|uniref:Family 43 glycosylhydrolase n=1 Tax=Seonamhaeicola marinus TaxID=1912246 RepID=A0A5D0IZ79_9FLAO|nr:family 43 glycosylhydrolase [Seonamhaeicola marinus]TYA89235.1 family 43 glycosylhydrolase [Seonamhaeicola marinus]
MNNQALIKIFALLLISLVIQACKNQNEKIEQKDYVTVCNPMDLSYRFRPSNPSRREAADPSILFFKGTYYLFASKSGGYWHSKDLVSWEFIETKEIPTEEYAPTTIVLRDSVFFMASSRRKSTIYKSANPLTGKWEVAKDSLTTAMWDPAFLLDDDNKLYVYWGCSNKEPIYGAELDPNSFDILGDIKELFYSKRREYGWEVRGDYNNVYDELTYMEGAWVNKFNDSYYLQYASPGTTFKSYNDAVYTSKKPLGPFELAKHNPFAYYPEGYACGAGHGSTFQDTIGNMWHFGTVALSVKHRFERRLSFFPSFLDDGGVLYTYTKYGDYPLIVPDKKIGSPQELFPGWMLLSYNKPVTVSSTLENYKANNMVDEEIRTYWSANSGTEGEWAIIDLEKKYDVHAIQLNFAEHNTNIKGRIKGIKHRYIIETSNDGENWVTVIDKSNCTRDNSHNYFQLDKKLSSRYFKVTNLEVPDGNFAISGFRIFGKGNGKLPHKNKKLEVFRNQDDRRMVSLKWDKIDNATGYNISYGSYKDKLYQNYKVHKDTSLTIYSLNTNLDYYFTIEAFNENGITESDLLSF